MDFLNVVFLLLMEYSKYIHSSFIVNVILGQDIGIILIGLNVYYEILKVMFD